LSPPPASGLGSGRQLLEWAAQALLDPQGRELAASVQWWDLPGYPDPWPVAVLGRGEPLLLLHGFDSSLLEFRRLAPLLAGRAQLFIPDLYGFGFSPRRPDAAYDPAGVIHHLAALLEAMASRVDRPVGVIGASMGGSVAMELARRFPERVNRLLLLSPAGLTGRPMPLPPLLDRLGVWFLGLAAVRRGLCRQAFADPATGVGPEEEEIASLHLRAPLWGASLARFARSGGFAGCGSPLPTQPITVLWGENDRILGASQKKAAVALLGDRLKLLSNCGHLPHLDQVERVAAAW
jgi:pimeloyl-ACP methyl ester carboxylesterase